MAKDIPLSVAIDRDTRTRLGEVAGAEDRSISQIVRRAIRHELIELDRIAKVARDGKARTTHRKSRKAMEAAIA
jgi:hypothetical protein